MTYTPKRGDLVQIGAAGRTVYTVLEAIPYTDRTCVRQHTTGKTLHVKTERLGLVFRKPEREAGA